MTEKPQCPTEQELELFSHDRLDAQVAVRIREHVKTCEFCTDTVECLLEDDDTRSAVADDDSPIDEIPPHVASVTLPKSSLAERSFLSPPQDSGDLGMLGPYHVSKEIGIGGMGIVYEAKDPQLNRRVALKVIKPEFAVDQVSRERFLREAQAVAAINHDNVVAIYQVGEAETLFLTMPLLEGETLASRLHRQQTMGVSEVLRIGREIAMGLDAAHRRGVMHRDVKPANIWLEAGSERVKLLDFGLARPTELGSDLTVTGTVAGTPRYMSPEQIEAREIDQRTDLYSLGCVLYRMLTGDPPFSAPTPLAVLSAMAKDDVTPLHEVVNDVPRPLSDLVMHLLQKEPENRPPSAAVVINELESIENSLDSSIHEPQLLRVMRRLPPAAQTALLLLSVGIVALATIVIRIKNKDGTESKLAVPTNQVESIEVEQDGETLADVDVDATPESVQALPHPSLLDRLKPIPLPPGVPPQVSDAQLVAILGDGRLNHWGPVTCAAFSPDGSLLATGGYDRILRVWNTKTGEEVQSLHGHGESIRSLAFSSDGGTLISADNLKKVIAWDVQSGEHSYEWTAPSSTLNLVTFDANDQPLALGSRPEGIVAWDVSTAVRKFDVAVKPLPDIRLALSPDDRSLAVVARGSREMQVFDTESAELLFSVPARTNLGTAAVFTPDGSRLAYLADADGATNTEHPAKKVVVCDARTGKLIRSFDSESAATLTISPDGKLVSAGGVFTTRVWEIESGREVQAFARHPAMVNAIAIDSAGAKVATASYDGSVRLWSLESGEQLISRNSHHASLACLAFSEDGTMLATGGVGKKVIVWDLATQKPLQELPEQPGLVTGVEFGTTRLAVVARSSSEPYNDPGGFSLWDAKTGRRIRTFGAIAHSITDYDQHIPGKVVSVHSDGTATVTELASKRRLMTLQQEGLQLSTAEFSPDGQSVAVGADSGDVLLWKLASDEPPKRLVKHDDAVAALVWSRDGRYLVSAGRDDRVKAWDLVRNEIVKEIAGQDQGVVSLAVTADGSRIAWTSYGGRLRLWNSREPQPQTLFQFNEGARHSTNRRFTEIALSPEGRYLATANQNGTAFLFRLAETRMQVTPAAPTTDANAVTAASTATSEADFVRHLPGHDGFIQAVAFGSDGTTVHSASYNTHVRRHNAMTGEELLQHTTHAAIGAAAFAADAERTLVGHFKVDATLWDRKLGNKLRVLPSQIDPTPHTTAVALSRDGKLAAVAYRDLIKVYDATNGNVVHAELDRYRDITYSMTFSSNGRYLATNTSTSLNVYDVQTGERLARKSILATARGLKFTPDDAKLIGGVGASLNTWDAKTLKLIVALEGHTSPIRSVDVSRNGKYAVTGSADKTIRVWDLQLRRQVYQFASPSFCTIQVAISPDAKFVVSGGGSPDNRTSDGDFKLYLWRMPPSLISGRQSDASRENP